MRKWIALGCVSAFAVLGSGSAGSAPAAGPAATARAYGIQVFVPGQSGAVGASVSAPPDAVGFQGGLSYLDVSAGSLAASAKTDVATDASTTASSSAGSVTLFGGEVTASGISARVQAATNGATATGHASASVGSLTVNGQALSTAGGRVELGDWGYAATLVSSEATSSTGGADTYHGFITALDIHLTAAHGSLPAGSEIMVGYAEATAQGNSSPPPVVTAQTPTVKAPTPKGKAKAKARTQQPPEPSGAPLGPTHEIPSGVQATVTPQGYVFPVYGPSSFSDSFGAPRADTGWHHGIDIFAPLGAPILAINDGTVFSVGWNDVGGNRLWLRDAQGNEWYYAHLSAFSPLAKNGNKVKAGEVLGFVGNTGDAEGTPYHLHFEFHPVSRLYMGYDGALDPFLLLENWKKLEDVRFNVAGWVPAIATARAPKPGAILLQSTDISEASGLDPGSLQRAVRAPVRAEGDGALLRAPLSPPTSGS